MIVFNIVQGFRDVDQYRCVSGVRELDAINRVLIEKYIWRWGCRLLGGLIDLLLCL